MVTARRTDPADPTPDAPRPAREPSRARYPEVTGIAERDGGRVAYEVYGTGDPPVMFVPPWQIVHSRIWKAQIPDFARRHRVIAWDARGNGRSDRPRDPAAHTDRAIAADLLAVLDATDTPSAVLVALSGAAVPSIIVATESPERVKGLVCVSPAVPIGQRSADRGVDFDAVLESDAGWAKQNVHVWRRDLGSYVEFFFRQVFQEPHSTKPIEDAVGYGSGTDAETLIATVRADGIGASEFRAMCARIECPALVIQGDRDVITHPTQGSELAAAIPGARLEVLVGSGHCPNVRDPVRVNLLIRDFIETLTAGATA